MVVFKNGFCDIAHPANPTVLDENVQQANVPLGDRQFRGMCRREVDPLPIEHAGVGVAVGGKRVPSGVMGVGVRLIIRNRVDGAIGAVRNVVSIPIG